MATFIGSPAMNLCEAGLSADGAAGTTPTVVLGSQRLALPAPVAARVAAASGSGSAGAAVADESAQPGILTASAPNGVARVDPRSGVRAGRRITFAVDPERPHFFDPDTGLAISLPAG